MTIDTLKKLEKIIEKDLPALEGLAIFCDKNVYTVFGKYQIIKKNDGCLVNKFNSQINTFGSLRSAISWCIADKYAQIRLATDIIDLDKRKTLLDSDIFVRSHLAKNIKNTGYLEAVKLKLNVRKDKLKIVNERLDKCINLAKYWQIKGFSNETARTGRTASNRTNR